VTTGRFREMLGRLVRAEGQSRSARTVELYGWLLLLEGAACLIVPDGVASFLRMPSFVAPQAANYFRLAGVWVMGIGVLYGLSGRLDASGFVFATLLDRPLVAPLMAILWCLGILPGTLALAAGLQDGLSALWTLRAWRGENASAARRPS